MGRGPLLSVESGPENKWTRPVPPPDVERGVQGEGRWAEEVKRMVLKLASAVLLLL